MVDALRLVKKFLGDDQGATGAEYALLLASVAASLAAFMLGEGDNNSSGLIEQAGCIDAVHGTELADSNSDSQGARNSAGDAC